MTYLLSQMEDLLLRLDQLTSRLSDPDAELDAAVRETWLGLIEEFRQLSSMDDRTGSRSIDPDSRKDGFSETEFADGPVEIGLSVRRPTVIPMSLVGGTIREGEPVIDGDGGNLINEVDAIVVMVSADGGTVVVNDVARRLLDGGSVASGVDGSVPIDIFGHPPLDDYRAIHLKVLKELKAGRPAPSLVNDVVASDGRRHRIKWSTSVISDEAGSILHIVYSGHDVSVERELRTQLLALDRLDSVGLLAGGLTHDFNNLLTIAGGNLELALDIGAMDEMARSRIEAALDAIEHGGEIAHRLLRVANHAVDSTPEGGAATNVVEVVTSLVEMLSGVVGPGIRINVEEVTPVGGVDIEPIHLEQVVLNLIMNACDAMKNEGSIIISIRELSEFAMSAVELSVRDDGPGMEPSKLKGIFAPFSTDANAEGHTGLGLTTARLLVESAGGSITASSELGVGTEMILNLPLSRSGGGGVNAYRSRKSVDVNW